MLTPELIRLITVFGYLVAAVFCGICALRWPVPPRGTWIGMTLLLTFLGLSKQWNVIPGWVQTLRDAAWLEGWYTLRRPLQVIFIIVILLFLLAWFLAILRNSPWQLWLPITAGTILLALSIVRAVSLHSLDEILYQELAPQIQPNILIELLSILVVWITALLASIFPQKPAALPPPNPTNS